MINKEDWIEYFPKGKTPKPNQIEAINFILNSFLEDEKRYVILEAPTGSGKSFIASTVAGYMNSLPNVRDGTVLKNKSYILTTQLILQDQYVKDFPSFANISSKSNFMCKKHSNVSCCEMFWYHKYGNVPKCSGHSCPYVKAKVNFSRNDISLTNVKFFLANYEYNSLIASETKSSYLINYRNLLVVDECHNLEEEICQYKGLYIELKDLKKFFDFDVSKWYNPKKETIYQWVIKFFHKWLEDTKEEYIQQIEKLSKNASMAEVKKLSNPYDYADKYLCQVNRFLNSYKDDRWCLYYDDKHRIVNIKPLFSEDFAHSGLFNSAKHILLMSGTIMNEKIFRRSLMIGMNRSAFLRLGSNYDVKNRPIFFINSGSMSKKNVHRSIYNVSKNIKYLLDKHKGQRGIIHVASHSLALNLKNHIKDKRIIIVNDFKKDRNKLLEYHYKSKDSVIISPSLQQGIDLKDDLSRFQIIAKLPYMYLGDKYVQKKMKVLWWWYPYQTAKMLTQSYGRSVRSETDYANTYILDGDWKRFYSLHKNMLPEYFKEALVAS